MASETDAEKVEDVHEEKSVAAKQPEAEKAVTPSPAQPDATQPTESTKEADNSEGKEGELVGTEQLN
jgi:hypothetical protein